MVNSINQINKKGILTSFSVEPYWDYSALWFLADAQLTKNSHPYPVQRILPHGYYVEYANLKDGRSDRWQFTVYSLSLTGNFCLKAGWVILSSSTTSHLGYKELRKIAFCGSNLPDGCPVRRFSERHWRNDWRETLFDSQDIISEQKIGRASCRERV